MSSSSTTADVASRPRGRFRRTDPLSGTPSANRRREVKFALPSGDAQTLGSVLEANCRRVQYGGASSLVKSIYFDDFQMSAYSESLDGVGIRAKVRLRWYGDDERSLFFEVKRRIGRAVEKVRVPIDSDSDLTAMHFPTIDRGLRSILPRTLAQTLTVYSEPILIVSYTRHYFEAYDAPLRITVDTDIQCYDQRDHRRPNLRFGRPLAGLVVLEGKMPVRLEVALPRLLYPLRPIVTRSSKYVMACDALGLVR